MILDPTLLRRIDSVAVSDSVILGTPDTLRQRWHATEVFGTTVIRSGFGGTSVVSAGQRACVLARNSYPGSSLRAPLAARAQMGWLPLPGHQGRQRCMALERRGLQEVLSPRCSERTLPTIKVWSCDRSANTSMQELLPKIVNREDGFHRWQPPRNGHQAIPRRTALTRSLASC
jgi:hypothetical protein